MPVIAIPPDSRLGDYEKAVRRAGGEPRILDQVADLPADVIRQVDGLLLAGGGDVQPSIYGSTQHPTYDAAEAGRDDYEIELVRRALAANLPVLAICRGVQVLNVARGGTLVQDIPSEVAGSLEHSVREPRDAIAHEVTIAPGSLLERLLGSHGTAGARCPVNSRHHQAPQEIGEGLVVTAHAPDGVIEALEDPTKRFCLGVQWHPENFWRTGEFSALFDAFVRACVCLLLCVAAGCTPASPAPAAPPIAWAVHAGDGQSTRWSTADDITPQTVAGLRSAWTWRTGETSVPFPADGTFMQPGRFQATPVMVTDTLYLSTPFNRVVALDAATGVERWAFDPGAVQLGPVGDDRGGFVHRGVAVWGRDGERRVFMTSRWWLIALDAATGRVIDTFGDQGRVDLTPGLRWPVNRLHIGNTSPPIVWGNIVIAGTSVADRLVYERDPPGAVQAFDVRTGERIWRWDPVPAAGHPDRASWGGTSADTTGHVNVWASMSVDAERGLLYLPVSTPSNDWYGGKRPGANLYADSIVCLDAATGRLVWYRQLVHHGLWDYEPAAPPVLATVRRNGASIDAVFVASKTGFLYVFDRVTGEPLWPLPEQPVPQSDVPGEASSPTQPHAPWPSPFVRQGFTRDDVIDFTPELRRQALALVDGKRLGPLFTPPSLEGTIVLPGWIGGAGWGSTALDPDRRLLLIKATNLPVLARLTPDPALGYRLDPKTLSDPALPLTVLLPGWRSWYGRWHDPEPLPILKPPYGTLTAVNIDTGDTRWHVVLGDTPGLSGHPLLRDLDLPPLGVAGAPGGVATRGGLVFITGGGNTLYAIDVRDGSVSWSARLRAYAYSNPMTYRVGGQQYVAVAVGQGGDAALQAFVLPR